MRIELTSDAWKAPIICLKLHYTISAFQDDFFPLKVVFTLLKSSFVGAVGVEPTQPNDTCFTDKPNSPTLAHSDMFIFSLNFPEINKTTYSREEGWSRTNAVF